MTPDDHRRLTNLRRRVARARRFPENTCPASRHVQMIAEALLRGRTWWVTEEPEHCAESMLAVVASLYKARTRLARVRGGDETSA